METMNEIRAALLRHHNIVGADDTQIMTVWHSLAPETQQEYLAAERKASHAPGSRSKTTL